MRRPWSRPIVATSSGLALTWALLALPLGAQEAKRDVEAPPNVRLPNHFAQLDPTLSDEQRREIYAIQEKALRECEAVLKKDQRASLDRLRREAEAKARERADQGADAPNVKVEGSAPSRDQVTPRVVESAPAKAKAKTTTRPRTADTDTDTKPKSKSDANPKKKGSSQGESTSATKGDG